MNRFWVVVLSLALSASWPSGAEPQTREAQPANEGATLAPASQSPRGPCGIEPYPTYPPLGKAPEVVVWTGDQLGEQWRPPSCAEWQRSSATRVIGLAGRFRDDRDREEVLAQIGAISSLRRVRYWSVTDKRWNVLFVRASALDGPDLRRPRGDFSIAEMHAPRDFYFLAADNRSDDDTVWRLRIRASEGRIVAETINVTPMHWFFLPLIDAGDFQTTYFLDREAEGSWRIYSLTRLRYVLPIFAYLAPSAAYANRALALYRHFAGIPADRDPP